MKPRSINIFLLDGDPNGIRVAQIMMSTIQAIAFRRNKLGDVRKTFPEIERPGVYILIGDDESEPERQLAYIGESEGVGDRLAYHNSNEKGADAKAFWTDTVVLISKDENLTKSHARYVEACLIRGAGSNPRWSLPNIKRPPETAGKLPLDPLVVPRMAFDVAQMQETQAEAPGLAGVGQPDQQIGDLLVLVLQLRAVAITGLADPEGPADQRNADPVSRHRFLGHLAALRWPRHFFPRASLSRSACMLRSAYIRFSRRFSSSMAFI